MVSRKINDSSYRENSLSARGSVLSHRPSGKEGSPGPFCSLTPHHCHAHLASGPRPVQAPAPSSQHHCISQPLGANVGPARAAQAPRARSAPPGTPAAQSRATPGRQVQVTAQHRLPHACAAFLPTRPAAGSHAVQDTHGVNDRGPPVIFFQPPAPSSQGQTFHPPATLPPRSGWC